MQHGVILPELQRLAEAGCRPAQIALPGNLVAPQAQYLAQMLPRSWIVRIAGQYFAESVRRRFPPLLFRQRVAEVITCIGVARISLQGALEESGGIVHMAPAEQRRAERIESDRMVRPRRNRPAQERY